MPLLNQIIAVCNGKKTQTEKSLTTVYHKLQKAELLTGIARTYQPKDEDGDKLPSESKKVQVRVSEALKEAEVALTDLFDVFATQEVANSQAKADVVVEGETILNDVPVTFLLFLEKKLVDVHTLVEKLPTLDPGEDWKLDPNQDCYSTNPKQSVKTKKIPRNHIKYEATKEHPAQVELFHEDVITGTWTTTNYSGAIPEQRKKELLQRVKLFQEAVKFAREKANSREVDQEKVGSRIFGYLFA